ncbi:hypothetical protein [Halorientalis persicus]|nr:hypothetical protein [Halorientalis persicus]
MSSSEDGEVAVVDGGSATGQQTETEAYDLPDGADRVDVLGEPGVKVVDREADPQERDVAVVINSPPSTCEDWNAYYDQEKDDWVTVAEDNPEYEADVPVVVVAYLPDIEEGDADIRPVESPVELGPLDVTYYSFPPGRVKIVDIPDHVEVGADSSEGNASDEGGEGEASDESEGNAAEEESSEPPEWELSDEFEALRDRLAESATVDVEHTEEGPVLAVEKLGTSYRIQEDGTITGDGALQDRLEDLVDEYL